MTDLRDTRVQLHWAAQVISAAADRWLPMQPDDGHSNMEWQPETEALVGNAMKTGLRVALALRGFELRAVRGDRAIATLALTGRTLADAMRWADMQIAGAEGDSPRGIHARTYDMPDHPVHAEGAAFSPEPVKLAALAGWFTHADAALRDLAAREPHAVPVRVWPHHFDIGSISFLDEPGPSSRQIGFGLSPGDRHYEQPYFYVTGYPLVADPQFPPLPGGGFWREQPPFVGAVLLGSSIVATPDPRAASRAFLEAAVAASRTLIASRPAS
jgi:hypothetical protein